MCVVAFSSQLLGTIPSYDREVISAARKPVDDCRLLTVGNSAALDSFVGVFTHTVSKHAGGVCALERLAGSLGHEQTCSAPPARGQDCPWFCLEPFWCPSSDVLLF